MAYGGYVLLGMRINRIVLPKQLILYKVPQKSIAKARSLLVKDNIPHVVRSSRETSDLEVYATSISKSLEEKLGIQPTSGEQAVSECELAGSAVRLKFLSSGWHRAVGKLYNPNHVEFNGDKYGVPINIYSALRIVVDKLHDGTYVLFVDPAKKVEFTESLEDIEQEYSETIMNEIQWVKIRGATTSFDIVKDPSSSIRKNLEEKISDRNFRENLSRVLGEYSGVELKIDYSNGYVVTTPRSNVLAGILKREVGVPTIEQGIPIIPLPKDILKPVASMENITLFVRNAENRESIQQEMTFLITPRNRPKKIEEILKNIDLHELNYNDLSIEIDVKNSFVNISRNIFAEFEIIEYFTVNSEKELANWKPDFRKYREDRESKIAILPIVLNLRLNGYEHAVLESIKMLKTLSRLYGLGYLNELRCQPSIQDVSEKLMGISKAYGEKIICAILFYHSCVGSGHNFIGQYRYRAATLKIHPYVVDLTDVSGDTIKYKIGSVLRKFAVKMNAISYRLKPPQIIRNHVVTGIDSTIYRTEKGGLYPVVIVSVLNPSGEISVETISGDIGLSDVDALASGIKSAVERYGDRGLLAIINRSSVVGVLQRLVSEKRSVQNLVSNGNLIIAGVSKTHSYSRILVEKNGRFYNPMKPGVLVKLSDYSLSLGGEAIRISRFLSITTTYFKENLERGTIKPVVISIASKMKEQDHLEIAKYIVSLSHFARISSSWAPSLPMPLHVANTYCRKLNSIFKALEEQRVIHRDINNVIKYI